MVFATIRGLFETFTSNYYTLALNSSLAIYRPEFDHKTFALLRRRVLLLLEYPREMAGKSL